MHRLSYLLVSSLKMISTRNLSFMSFTDLPTIYGTDLGGSVLVASSEGSEPIARCVIWNEVSA